MSLNLRLAYFLALTLGLSGCGESDAEELVGMESTAGAESAEEEDVHLDALGCVVEEEVE